MKKFWAKAVYNQIHENEKVLHWYEKFGYNIYYYYLTASSFLSGKQIPMNFVYLTNTLCTLRCKECHSYMPYWSKDKHYMASFESFKTEIDKLLKSVDIITSFRFQGGETLLVKDLAKMVEYACSKKQIQHIQIISNGTIVPSEELIKAMQNPKVLLSLSDYSCNEELNGRLKYDEILKLCKENNVHAKHWLTKKGDLWIARNVVSKKPKIDEELAIKNRNSCVCFASVPVTMFYQGKMFLCPPAVYFSQIHNFEMPEDEMVDVINTPPKLLTKKINRFMTKKWYTLCAYCNSYANREITSKPGVQLETTSSAN